ncbi:MAG: DUF3305 domain-containing protein [Granulosicoccus sp.]|nr:DUF3305 domain-containing protein [Granulosicoccus sp.]
MSRQFSDPDETETNQAEAPAPGPDTPAYSSGSPTRLKVPVGVVLEKRLVSRSFWSLPSWYLHTVAVGHHLAANQTSDAPEGKPAGTTSEGELFAWSNFHVTFYKDACERYWHALIGDRPLVYVICDEETMHPVIVTVDYDEANAHAETDIPVLSTEIPAELYRLMERFVLDHYRPKEFKKRKRRQWTESDGQRGKRQ